MLFFDPQDHIGTHEKVRRYLRKARLFAVAGIVLACLAPHITPHAPGMYMADYGASFWIQLIIYLVIMALSYALAPKPKNAAPVAPKPAGIEDLQLPTATAGREIPVLFGMRWINSPNVVWYGDLAVDEKTERTCV